MGYPDYEKQTEKKDEHTHSLFVVVTGTPQSLFEVQRELLDCEKMWKLEIKKFEIKPIANS